MEAGRNPNLLKLDVRSVEMFRQTKKLHVREVMMALIVFETKTNPDDVQIRGRGGGGWRSSRP